MMRMESNGVETVKVENVIPDMIVKLFDDGPDVVVDEVWHQGEGLGVVIKGRTVKTDYMQTQRFMDTTERVLFVGWTE